MDNDDTSFIILLHMYLDVLRDDLDDSLDDDDDSPVICSNELLPIGSPAHTSSVSRGSLIPSALTALMRY